MQLCRQERETWQIFPDCEDGTKNCVKREQKRLTIHAEELVFRNILLQILIQQLMKYVNLYQISASISKHTYTLTRKRAHRIQRAALPYELLVMQKTTKHKIPVKYQNQYSGHGYLVLLINYYCSDQCYLFMSKATQNGRGKKHANTRRV